MIGTEDVAGPSGYSYLLYFDPMQGGLFLDVSPVPAPEPATLLLATLGLVGAVAAKAWKRAG